MKFIKVIGNIAVITSVTMFAAGLAHARAPTTAADLKAQNTEYMATVAKGDALWHGGAPKSDSVRLACGNCHPDASSIGPQTWPKYSLDLGKVAAMRDMINWCVMVVHQGPAMDMNGADMQAMETYATYMSRGMALDPNNNTRQMMAVKVKGGAGYPELHNTTEFDGSKNPFYDPKIDPKLKTFPKM